MVQRSLNSRRQIGEDVLALLAARLDHALQVRSERVAALALAAEARFSPSDQGSQLPFAVKMPRPRSCRVRRLTVPSYAALTCSKAA
jgi:hypothetical protein